MYQEILNDLKNNSDENFSAWLKPFINFSNYEGEILLGVRTPILRKLAKKYKEINDKLLLKLLQNKIHETRMLAIFIMLLKVKKEPEKICKIYLDNLDYINNWDLIDYSAPHIVAANVSKEKLKELFNNTYLWSKRVAIVSTIYYIKQMDFDLTFYFAKESFSHPHHLIHKACGWMLREIGKRDRKKLIDFLEENKQAIPSIMKNYAKECLK